MTDKVTALVSHADEVLVFEHPTAGIQFPAGTVEPGESALDAARREAHEEVGIILPPGRVTGVSFGEVTRRFVAWDLEKRPALPEYCETDGHRFRPFWLAQDELGTTVHPRQRSWWDFAPHRWSAAPRFTRLERGDVALRAMRDLAEDYRAMGAWMSDERVLRWYGGAEHCLDADGARARYAPRVRGEDDVHPAIIVWDGRDVGYLQYYPIDDGAEYGIEHMPSEPPWALDLFVGEPELWGTGVGTAAIELVLRYLAQDLGIAQVYIDPLADNERAMRAYAKCGFERVGVLSSHVVQDGVRHDCVIMRADL